MLACLPILPAFVVRLMSCRFVCHHVIEWCIVMVKCRRVHTSRKRITLTETGYDLTLGRGVGVSLLYPNHMSISQFQNSIAWVGLGWLKRNHSAKGVGRQPGFVLWCNTLCDKIYKNTEIQ